MIPKIIHYCWLSGDDYPDDLKKYMQTWKENLKDYEFICWDPSRFDLNQNMWVKEAYDAKKYAFAADYIRLYAVYNFGGIYLDMDVEVIKPFDKLLNYNYMFAYERPDQRGIEAGCFGAEKGDSFLRRCLESYEGKHFIKDDGEYDMTPLPQIMEKIMLEGDFNYNIYASDFFTAKSYETGIEKITENTFCIHHFAGSWKTDTEKEKINKIRKYSRYTSYFIASNIVDFQYAFKEDKVKGVLILFKEKLKRKFKNSLTFLSSHNGR